MEDISKLTLEWLHHELGTDLRLEKHTFSHQDEVYLINSPSGNFYLKVNSRLETERDNINKVNQFLLAPKVVGFVRIEDKDHLLLSEVPGSNLVELVGDWDAESITKEFAKSVRKFHRLSIHDFSEDNDDLTNSVVLHGDMSLPNVIINRSGNVGYIDLGQMSVGNPDVDLSDAIWSLQRNLGPGYGEIFLKEYGEFVMTEKLEKALAFRHAS